MGKNSKSEKAVEIISTLENYLKTNGTNVSFTVLYNPSYQEFQLEVWDVLASIDTYAPIVTVRASSLPEAFADLSKSIQIVEKATERSQA